MARQYVCPDCKRVFNSLVEFKKHTARHILGHKKAKRQIKRLAKSAKTKTTRQHPTVRQYARQQYGAKPFQRMDPNLEDAGWANRKRQPWNTPGRPVGKRVARQVRDLENDRYWETR